MSIQSPTYLYSQSHTHMVTKNNSPLIRANTLKRRDLSWTSVRLPLVSQENIDPVAIQLPVASFLPTLDNSVVEVPLSVFMNNVPLTYQRARVEVTLQQDPNSQEFIPHITGFVLGFEPSKDFKRDRSKLRANLTLNVGANIYKCNFVLYSKNRYTARARVLIINKIKYNLISSLSEGITNFFNSFFITKKTMHNLRRITFRNPFHIELLRVVSGPLEASLTEHTQVEQ